MDVIISLIAVVISQCICMSKDYFVHLQFHSVSQLCPTLRPHGLQHTNDEQASLFITNSRS